MSTTKKTVSFSLSSPEEKNYLDAIAKGKGYGNISTMARVALVQMLTRMKVEFTENKAITSRETAKGAKL